MSQVDIWGTINNFQGTHDLIAVRDQWPQSKAIHGQKEDKNTHFKNGLDYFAQRNRGCLPLPILLSLQSLLIVQLMYVVACEMSKI